MRIPTNMKKIIYAICICIVLLSSCAKVTHEAVPCEYTAPPVPYVLDILIQPGGSGSAIVTNSRFDSVLFTGPNNFTFTSKTGVLFLDFYVTSNYGKYTATSISGGCKSMPDTFNVVDNFTGAPTLRDAKPQRMTYGRTDCLTPKLPPESGAT